MSHNSIPEAGIVTVVAYERVIASESCYDFVADNLKELLGYDSTDFLELKKHWSSWIHPDDQQIIASKLSGLKIGDRHSLQYRLKHKDSHYCWVQDDFRVIQQSDQLILLGTWLNISSQQELQNSLHKTKTQLTEAQELTQNILEAIDIPVFTKDGNNCYVHTNRSFHDFFRLTTAEISGKTDSELFAAEQAHFLYQQELEIRQTKKSKQSVMLFPQQLNNAKAFSIRKSTLQIGTHQYLLGVGEQTGRSPSQEKNPEQSLDHLHKLTKSIPGMVYHFHRDKQQQYYFTYISQYCQNIFEVNPALGMADSQVLFDMVHPEDLEGLLRSIELAFTTKKTWQYQWRIITPSGKLKWLQGVAESEQFRDEELMWIGVILDVSDRQQTLMALAQSQTQFNKVADSVPGMLYQLVRKPDGEMILTYVNNYCRDISGRSRGRYWETHQDESSGGS